MTTSTGLDWLDRLADPLAGALDARPCGARRVGGGDVAEAARVMLDDDRTVFVKTHARPPTGFFTTEAAGLAWLRDSGTVRIPDVLAVSDEPPFLVLEWIEIGGRARDDAHFGRQLAALHRRDWPRFGRPDRRTTGSLAVPNDPVDDWPTFYAERRLLPLARIARERGVIAGADLDRVERIASRLHAFGAADEPPALLHGDLWAGNRVADRDGRSVLIDPAAHGGHREFDLAMMRLFGGFGEACHQAYQEIFPLQAGWQARIGLHQLAPLLVHAIKFGGHYVGATGDLLRRLNGNGRAR